MRIMNPLPPNHHHHHHPSHRHWLLGGAGYQQGSDDIMVTWVCVCVVCVVSELSAYVECALRSFAGYVCFMLWSRCVRLPLE